MQITTEMMERANVLDAQAEQERTVAHELDLAIQALVPLHRAACDRANDLARRARDELVGKRHWTLSDFDNHF